jgi:hypothetical protein
MFSESKRIMNELSAFCSKNDILVIQSAADSILIPSSKVQLLEARVGDKISNLKIVHSISDVGI